MAVHSAQRRVQTGFVQSWLDTPETRVRDATRLLCGRCGTRDRGRRSTAWLGCPGYKCVRARLLQCSLWRVVWAGSPHQVGHMEGGARDAMGTAWLAQPASAGASHQSAQAAGGRRMCQRDRSAALHRLEQSWFMSGRVAVSPHQPLRTDGSRTRERLYNGGLVRMRVHWVALTGRHLLQMLTACHWSPGSACRHGAQCVSHVDSA